HCRGVDRGYEYARSAPSLRGPPCGKNQARQWYWYWGQAPQTWLAILKHRSCGLSLPGHEHLVLPSPHGYSGCRIIAYHQVALWQGRRYDTAHAVAGGAATFLWRDSVGAGKGAR